MRFEPYAYQRAAIDWVIEHRRCCLFLDMGLGKSVITLTAIQTLIDGGEVSRALVVAPKTVAEATWTAEARKWDHLAGLTVVSATGTRAQREAALDSEADVHVIGRDNFVWLMERYDGRLPWDMIVLDELTSFKSPTSRRFKAMRQASPAAYRVVGLTGTPAPNGLQDLWAQMYCVDLGERLGRWVTKYRKAYFNEVEWNGIVIKSTLKKGAEATIRRKVADICLSMQASDYLQMPDMVTITEKVDLDTKARAAYERMERECAMEFFDDPDNRDTATVVANGAAALMNKLSQMANGAVYDDDGAAHHVHDAKLERLREIVEAAGDSGVLVFYQYKHDRTRIMNWLKGYRVRMYEGAATLEAWNGREIDVLLAHPASTAFGLNMQQGGHYIVWFGTGWNLELYQQANARLHRQGQRHPVTVYRLVTAGTVDERMAAAIDSKKNVQQALLDGLKYLGRKYGKECEICEAD